MKRSIQPGIATGASLLTAALLFALVTPAAFAVDADPTAPSAVASSTPADPTDDAAPTDAAPSDAAAADAAPTDAASADAASTDSPSTDAPASDAAPTDPGTLVQQAIVGSGAGITNSPPTPQDDVYQVQEDQVLTSPAPGVLGNDTDPDGDPLVIVDDTKPAHGTWDLNTDGGLYYQPDPGYLGTDTMTYLVSDGISAPVSATITFNVVFDPALNHAPVEAQDLYTTPVDTPLVVTAPGIFANDHDADGDTISLSSITATTHDGSLSVNNDGSFTYTPNSGYYGDDQFQYRSTDGTDLSTSTTLVNIQVGGPFSDPIAADDHYSVTPGTTFTTSAPGFVANDTQDGKPVNSVALTFPQWVHHGTLDIHVDGSLSYTPDPGFTGTDTLQYRVGGYGQLYSNAATITFTVGSIGQGGGGGSGGGSGGGCAPTAPCPPVPDSCTDAAGVPIPSCGAGGGSHLSHLALTGTTPMPYLVVALLLGLTGISVLVAHSVRRRSVARRAEMGR